MGQGAEGSAAGDGEDGEKPGVRQWKMVKRLGKLGSAAGDGKDVREAEGEGMGESNSSVWDR